MPVGFSLELMAGNKIVLNVGDIVKIDCSVADKLSVNIELYGDNIMPYLGNTAGNRFVASKAATQFSGDGSKLHLH